MNPTPLRRLHITDPHTDTRSSAEALTRLPQREGFHLPHPTGEWSCRAEDGRSTTRIDHAIASPGLRVLEARYLYKAGRHVLAGAANGHGEPLSDHALLSIRLERPTAGMRASPAVNAQQRRHAGPTRLSASDDSVTLVTPSSGPAMTTSSTTLKLPAPLKKRIAALAVKSATTPHALMVSALEDHVAREERWQEFVKDAAQSDRGAEAGDPVYAANDVHAWLEDIARGKPTRRPKPWRK